MPRKKTVSSEQSSSVGSDQLPANGDQLTAKDQYYTGTWAGHEHFECNACAYDTFDEVEMLNHLVDRHNSEQALAVLIALEPAPPPTPPQMAASTQSEEGSNEIYEIELKEDQEHDN